MKVIPVILLTFLLAPPTLLQTFGPEYRLQCNREELGIRWPSYVNSGNYYVCQGEHGSQLQISCPRGELFSFVLQVCTAPEAHIPPPPLDVLPISPPILAGPVDEPLPIVPWLPKPLTPKEPLPGPPHISAIGEQLPPHTHEQPPQPPTVGAPALETAQPPSISNEIPAPAAPPLSSAVIPPVIPQSPAAVPPPPPGNAQPPSIPPTPPSISKIPAKPQPPKPPLKAAVKPQIPSPMNAAAKPRPPLPPTPPPTPPIFRLSKMPLRVATTPNPPLPPLPPKKKMPPVPVKRNKN